MQELRHRLRLARICILSTWRISPYTGCWLEKAGIIRRNRPCEMNLIPNFRHSLGHISLSLATTLPSVLSLRALVFSMKGQIRLQELNITSQTHTSIFNEWGALTLQSLQDSEGKAWLVKFHTYWYLKGIWKLETYTISAITWFA